MRCPYCKQINQDKVIDSRLSENGDVVRRRRMCLSCNRRYTTKERVDLEIKMMVIKRDGGRVPFDRTKVLSSLQRACYKRPVAEEKLSQITDEVEDQIFRKFDREVPSSAIGVLIGSKLRAVDQIAYVRYASVYRRFKDLGELIDEAKEIMEQPPEVPGQQKLFDPA